MPRPTPLLEGRTLLLIAAGVVLAALWLLAAYDTSAAEPGPTQAALVRQAAFTGRATVQRRPGQRSSFTVVRDTLDEDSLRALGVLPGDTLDPDTPDADTLDVDSLALGDTTLALGDTTEVLPDTGRASRLLPPFRRDDPTASLRPRRRTPLGPDLGAYWQRQVALDSTEAAYTITERVGGGDVRVPVRLGLEAYRAQRLRLGLEQNYRDLAQQRARQQQRRSGFGIGIDIPGGAGRGLEGIFGSNEVDLRVNGQANVDVGFAYRQNEQQEAATGQGGRVDPDFGQELGLGITGTIGDKLQINVNYDTQNDFDFQNQVRLTYTGYEDEILQRVEAGNVFLQTPSDLIRGGQRLFGIRTDLKVGGLGVTVVASQQDAESDELVIEGGSQTTEFSKRPTQYEDNANFYLGYYFHNRWDDAHGAPPNINLGPGFSQILEGQLEVYLFEQSNANNTGNDDALIRAAAFVDLGEPSGSVNSVLAQTGAYADEREDSFDDFSNTNVLDVLSPAVDQYDEADLARIRAAQSDTSRIDFQAEFGLASADFFVSTFKKLREGQDYTWDPLLGTLSLKRSLNNNEAVAVAYRYQTTDNRIVEIGDFGRGSGSDTDSDNIVLKLLRGPNPNPRSATWDLTMRNVYRVGGSSFDATDFELQVIYARGGQTAQRTLPGVDIGQPAQTLLQTLGLDRVNQDGVRAPDDLFDFLRNYTVDPGGGRIIFPYRQPFGAHLRRVLRGQFTELGQTTDVAFQGITEATALNEFAFDTLYNAKPEIAAQETDKNVYEITGAFSGSVQEIYDLGFSVVESSVQVRSGNIELVEGSDYRVDYTTGTVTISNPAYLVPGRDVSISFERNQFVAIQKKTLLGVRADYEFSDRFGLGATWMRLSEKPLIDKYRIGEEPIANSIWGFDARYAAEPRWITRLVDALPLVQTRAPSAFEFKGEFAQLNPGHPETFAFDESRADLQDLNRDFKDDELDGISYIDDFEGTENAFSLLQPGAWRLAAAPEGNDESPGAGPPGARTYLSELPMDSLITSPRLRTSWRGLFAWYTVLTGTFDNDDIGGLVTGQATSPVRIREIFPERDLQSGAPPTLSTLDVYHDPSERGAYNFNASLGTAFAQNPQDVWGGMTQRLPEGYTDFDARNNIEFVEFIFSPFGGANGDEAIDGDATLYVELGQTSEDVLPNRQYNNEDGLLGVTNEDLWGRPSGGQQDGIVSINEETQRTEDLGLDGLPSTIAASAAAANGTPYDLTEDQKFGPFLDSLRATLPAGDPTLARALLDPANDDFHSFQDNGYFNDGTLWPGGATLQERFSQFFNGLELNSLEAQNQIAGSGTPGNSRFPDSEDLNLNLSLDQAERFFRYEVPLADGVVDVPCTSDGQTGCNPFYVTTINNPDPNENPSGREWYLIRIPVRSDRKEAIGGIEDFQLIETVRLWTDGHVRPATVRFATLDLVGSQWLKSDRVGIDEEDEDGGLPEADLTPPQSFIATINNEENPNQYEIPNGTVRSFTRDPASSQPIQSREQALVLRVDNLDDGQSRGIFKPYTRQLDLTKYSNLRMFVHGEGFEQRDSLRVFVRIGSNETEDYYEIEQPLYAYDLPPGVESIETVPSGADSLWQTNVPVSTPEGTRFIDRNSINIDFGALNRLKLERDLFEDDTGNPFPVDDPFDAQTTDLDFAPPGAVLRIRGEPSIKDVSNIVLGVRNVGDGSRAPVDIELWYNELRVSGFDEDKGWSAYARSNVRLADFIDLNARFEQQTDGFGNLASGLGDRTFQDSWGYSVTTNVNMHKLLPERYGWRIPVNFALQQDVQTPRFSPSRGDITVEQEIAQIEESTLPPDEKAQEIATVRAAAETSSFSRVIRVPISKTGSRSPWLKYTLDGVALTYTNTRREQRSPSRLFNDTDQWNGAFSYRLAVPRPKTVRPFWFLGDTPLVGVLGGLRLNVLPQSFRFSADAGRSVVANQDRPRRFSGGDSLRLIAEERFPDFVYPVRQQHTFSHRRNLELQYNPFDFLALGYRSDVRQSLNTAGTDERVAVLIQSRVSGDLFETYDGLTFDEVFEIDADSNLIGPGFTDFGITDPDSVGTLVRNYPISQLNIVPATEVFSDVIGGVRRALTDNYNQTATATVQSPFEKVKALNWFRLQPITYSSSFNWLYTPLPGINPRDTEELDRVGTVATLQNQGTVRGGLSLRFGELFGKFGFYRGIRESQEAAQQAKLQDKQDFERELQRYRVARDRVDRAETALREAEAGLEEAADTSAAAPDILDALRTDVDNARAAADTLRRPSPPLPIPNPLGLLRRGFLAFTGPRDLTVTYNGSFSGASQGVRDPGYSFLDGITGGGPSIGYRLGFIRRIGTGLDDRFFGDDILGTLQVQDNLRENHQVGARTALEFSQALRVDLTWDLGLNNERTFAFSRDNPDDPTITERGGGSATVLALGGSYQKFFDLHRARFDEANFGGGVVDSTSGFLADNAVVEDFRSAFVTGLGAVGRGGFGAFPLPNWSITYTGISNFPIISALTQSATLRHGYSATYDVGFTSNPQAGIIEERTLTLPGDNGGVRRFISNVPFLEANTVRVSERFQPLIGLNLGFKGGIQTDLTWSESESYALTPTVPSVNQLQTRELSLRLSFNKTGLRLPIPFLRRRLNNNIRFSLIVSQANNLARRFDLRTDLGQDIAGARTETFLDPQGEITTRLSVEPQITYTISNQVTTTAFVRYQKFDSEGSRNPSTTTINGGFTFRVSFSN